MAAIIGLKSYSVDLDSLKTTEAEKLVDLKGLKMDCEPQDPST